METLESLTLNSSASYLPDIPLKEHGGLWIFGESESKRRVIFIEKKNGSYGFTLQSYGVRYKHGNRETDFITYVNAVEKEGSAYLAGLREGDVILSINGQNMARVEHKSLVGFIRKCPSHLKMIVVSDERARKVELHMRYVHLQKKLQDKMKELEELNWKENEILAGTYKNPCGTPVGDACLSAASTNCCFCRQRTTEVEQLISTDDTKRQRSKSVKASSSSTSDKFKDTQYSYDFYRKCQSSRELHKDASTPSSSSGFKLNTPTSKSGPVATTSTCPHSRSLSNKETNAPSSKSLNTHQQRTNDREQMKPKSWDNLMGTKAFGGYGFGFGYGYYPSKELAQPNCSSHVTHPHHHNHHSHSSTRCNANYYSSKSKCVAGIKPGMSSSYGIGAGNSGVRPVIPSTSTCAVNESTSRCKTLPTKKGNVSHSTAENFPKMERTLSDSSLNSEHHKDFPKTMSYFKRSGDNVRFSSDEEYESYVKEDYARSQDRDHIFV